MKSAVIQSLKAGLVHPSGCSVYLQLETLVERKDAYGNIPTKRIFLKDNEETFITSVEQLLSEITEEKVIITPVTNRKYDIINPISIELTSVRFKLFSNSKEDRDIGDLSGDCNTIILIVGYCSDNDKEIPLKPVNLVLTRR